MATDTIALAIKHCQEPVPRLPEHLQRFQYLIDRMMAKEVKNRFQNGVELMTAIDDLLNSSPNKKPSPILSSSSVTPTPLTMADENAISPAPLISVYDKPMSEVALQQKGSVGYEPFFDTNEIIGGNFFFKKYSFGILRSWLNQRCKKASELTLEIQAHPWIHGRIWDALTDDQPFENPFGIVLEQATVSLHIYDEVEPQGGRRIVLREKGKKTQTA